MLHGEGEGTRELRQAGTRTGGHREAGAKPHGAGLRDSQEGKQALCLEDATLTGRPRRAWRGYRQTWTQSGSGSSGLEVNRGFSAQTSQGTHLLLVQSTFQLSCFPPFKGPGRYDEGVLVSTCRKWPENQAIT